MKSRSEANSGWSGFTAGISRAFGRRDHRRIHHLKRAMLLVLLLITFVPETVLYLPGMFES